jgi:hypothetical protein
VENNATAWEGCKMNQDFLSEVKRKLPVVIASLLFIFTVSGCRIKIAGDDYIVGPLPTYSDHQQGDRRQNIQEPSPPKRTNDEEMEKEKREEKK